MPNGPHCLGCPLQYSGQGFMRVDGQGRSGVMLVGEALGADEADHKPQPVPFIGAAGHLLRKVIKRHVKAERDDFYIANTLYCRPPNNKLVGARYQYEAIDQCAPHLDADIDRLQPKVLVALGDVAMQRLLGMTGISMKQNYAWWSDRYSLWVVPALHPSYVQRGNHRYQPVLGHAIRKAMRIAEGGYEHEKFHTIHHPSVSELEIWAEGYFRALRENPKLTLAADIETHFKAAKDESQLKSDEDPSYQISQISFAYNGHEGISAAWTESNRQVIEKILASPGKKLFWNMAYDVPRLRENGVIIKGGIRDTMTAWHVLHSDLPKGLGFVTPLLPGNHRVAAWKHLSDEEGGWEYSALDSIHLWRNDDQIMQSLDREGILPFYKKYVEQVRPVLTDMERAGVLVDEEARAELTASMDAELADLEQQMQEIVPDDIKPIHPKKGYKKDPSEEALAAAPHRRIVIPDQDWTECPACKTKNPPKTHFKEFRAKAHLHKNTMCSGLVAEPIRGDEKRWAKIMPFTPSPKQLVDYAKAKGYQVFTNYKTKAPTMDDEAIGRYLKRYKGDRLFPLIQRYRSVQKMRGLYGSEGIAVHSDGRVHTHFSDNPSTLRFASYGPNMQNFPRPGDQKEGQQRDYAKQIRNLIIAAPGHVFGARDFTGIEAVIVGYLAADPGYMRVAKLGVHDFFNAHMAYSEGILPASDLPDLSWPDDQLGAYLAKLKEDLADTRPRAKSICHGSNYLATPFRIFQIAPHQFGTMTKAQETQALYFEVFPKIKKWQEVTCKEADKHGYLISPFGFPQRFYQVYEYKKDEENGGWKHVLGEDAKKAVAANPQHIAAAIMRDSIRRLGDTEVRPWLRLTIHDELLWECPAPLAESVDHTVKEIMERPVKALPLRPEWNMGEYLQIGTEAKHGTRWGEMK